MSLQKKVAAIHDISGFGKCSLTVALPIISAMGISASAVPTAVLSTHTGPEFVGYSYRDLTQDMRKINSHWCDLGLKFDSIYSGYIGSFEQIEIVSNLFDSVSAENCLILVDPVMGDHGRLYPLYTQKMADGMRSLCTKADIIVPNITEASFLTNSPYVSGPLTKGYVESLIEKLSALGCNKIVLTGVSFNEIELGAAVYSDGKITYCMNKRVNAMYHGTGDIFGSALLSLILNGKSIVESAQGAVNYVMRCMQRTKDENIPTVDGVNFEGELPFLMKYAGII